MSASRTSVVLFGAGASRGLAGVVPSSPPLGSSLYQALAAAFPESWGALPAPLAAALDGDFEGAMSRLWADRSVAVAPLMQDLACLFARYTLAGDRRDAYSLLLDRLAAGGALPAVRFASLNYDCLFEEAAAMAGLGVAYFDGEPGPREVVLWKVHGSCNFLPAARDDVPRAAALPPPLAVDVEVCPVSRDAVAPFCRRDSALYPAMAIYAQGKPVQIAPAVLGRLQARYADAVRAASVVVVVGVTPAPEDRHVWDPVAATPAPVLYVGQADAFETWTREHRAGRPVTCLGDRFDEAVPRIVEAIRRV